MINFGLYVYMKVIDVLFIEIFYMNVTESQKEIHECSIECFYFLYE